MKNRSDEDMLLQKHYEPELSRKQAQKLVQVDALELLCNTL